MFNFPKSTLTKASDYLPMNNAANVFELNETIYLWWLTHIFVVMYYTSINKWTKIVSKVQQIS